MQGCFGTKRNAGPAESALQQINHREVDMKFRSIELYFVEMIKDIRLFDVISNKLQRPAGFN
jgi:cytidylate kinase